MSWIWYVIIILILSFIGFMLSQIKIKIYFNKEDKNDFLEFDIWFLYLFHFRKRIPLLELDEGIKTESESDLNHNSLSDKKKNRITVKELREHYQHYKIILERISNFKLLIKDFTKHVHIDSFRWESTIGTGDASNTGILNGIAWVVKSYIIGWLSCNTLLKINPMLLVKPEYKNKIFKSKFECIFRFRVGYFIVTSMRLLFKYLIGGGKKWQENILSKA